MARRKVLPPHELRRLAVAAQVDPRTVAKYLRGGYVQPMPKARIAAVLAAEVSR